MADRWISQSSFHALARWLGLLSFVSFLSFYSLILLFFFRVSVLKCRSSFDPFSYSIPRSNKSTKQHKCPAHTQNPYIHPPLSSSISLSICIVHVSSSCPLGGKQHNSRVPNHIISSDLTVHIRPFQAYHTSHISRSLTLHKLTNAQHPYPIF
ncbi:hypothetical protein F5H01DRAFT_168794 [Linnemannia elongata]|nr:hypothetical protein F5H01DRAFT_168794 [Linnemannia elongata]